MSTSYYVTPKKECRTCEHRNKLPYGQKYPFNCYHPDRNGQNPTIKVESKAYREFPDEQLEEKFRATKFTNPEWKPLYEEVVRRKEAKTPATEAIEAPEKPAEAISTKIDRLQSQIDVFVEKGQKPPSELISEINAAKKELRQKPLTITGIKAKVLAQPEAVEVAPELEPLAKEARRSRRTNRAASQSNR